MPYPIVLKGNILKGSLNVGPSYLKADLKSEIRTGIIGLTSYALLKQFRKEDMARTWKAIEDWEAKDPDIRRLVAETMVKGEKNEEVIKFIIQKRNYDYCLKKSPVGAIDYEGGIDLYNSRLGIDTKEKISQLLDKNNALKILDIGCGGGYYPERLEELYPGKVTGYGVSLSFFDHQIEN